MKIAMLIIPIVVNLAVWSVIYYFFGLTGIVAALVLEREITIIEMRGKRILRGEE